MELSVDVIRQFTELTKAKTGQTNAELMAYGTVVELDGDSDTKYVQLDGSTQITPVETTADLQVGDRVMVTIKNHTATVIGNVTSPSASSGTVVFAINSIQDTVNKQNSETLNAAKSYSDSKMEGYVEQNEYDEYKQEATNKLNNEVNNLGERIDNVNEKTNSVDEARNAFEELIKTYFDFNPKDANGDIVSGLLIRRENTKFQTLYGENGISFYYNDVRDENLVAYIRHDKMYIRDAHFIHGITFGNNSENNEWSVEVDDYGWGISYNE